MESHRILIVEDEPTLQLILGSVLSDAGHHVDAVASAEEALPHLQAESVDLVLSDKNLPGMSGLELLSKVRTGVDPLQLFILVTGYPSIESALHLLAEDGDGYLVKPFRSLVNVVESIQKTIENTAQKKMRKQASLLARGVTASLLSTEDTAKSNLRNESYFLHIDDDTVASRIERALQARGVQRCDALTDATLFFAARIDDLAAASLIHCAKIFVDASPRFADLVALIDQGGGSVLDPSLVVEGGEI